MSTSVAMATPDSVGWVRGSMLSHGDVGGSTMTEVSSPAANQPERVDWRVWWRLARPFTLTASIIPVLVGTAVAVATVGLRRPELFVAMLVASIFIQIATNMFNEYFDFRHGLDTPETVGI